MDDTKVMLKAIIYGQSSMKSELLVEIKKLNKRIDRFENNLNHIFKVLINELNKLDKKIAKIEQKMSFA